MRMLRVRQDQLEDATRSVVRHAQGGKSSGVDESNAPTLVLRIGLVNDPDEQPMVSIQSDVGAM